MDKRCGTCRFRTSSVILPAATVRYDLCQFFPPAHVPHTLAKAMSTEPYPGYGRWPEVSVHEWCGQWQPKAEKVAVSAEIESGPKVRVGAVSVRRSVQGPR